MKKTLQSVDKIKTGKLKLHGKLTWLKFTKGKSFTKPKWKPTQKPGMKDRRLKDLKLMSCSVNLLRYMTSTGGSSLKFTTEQQCTIELRLVYVSIEDE